VSARRILVTTGLPYANGALHIGHMVEDIQGDIWARFQRMRGHRVLQICGDDTHGTATMIAAARAGRSEEDLIAEMNREHQRDYEDFGVHYDHYGSTNSDANRALCHEIWQAVVDADLVAEKEVTQLYDAVEETFLADRQVKGTCPRCKSPDQNGDYCDDCGANYAPPDLIDPVSALSGTTPELRTANHVFIRLEKLQGFLETWTQAEGHLQEEAVNYLKGAFLREPLLDWDISRPPRYFGFEIPGWPGNYWYVWFTAPIGYISTTKEWCDANGEALDDWWRSEQTEIHHFIGKDITYFHCLFWPAMLKTAGFSLPTRVQIHGMLTVDGGKMSKSKGTFIRARTWLDHLDPSYLRYYYASKLTNRIDDFDLGLDDLVAKVNSDLVGKVVNLASRTARFVKGLGLSRAYPEDGGLFHEGVLAGEEIAACYERCDFSRAMKLVMGLADRANEYVEQVEPWKLKKDPEKVVALQEACTVALNLFRQIAIYLAPVLPRLAEQAGELFQAPIVGWADAREPLVGISIRPFEHLMQRVDPKKLAAVIEASKETAPEGARPGKHDGPEALEAEPVAATCSFDDFTKVDLRVARVVAAEEIPEARKLLKLTLSLGGEERRTVFAGIKGAYEAEALVGRLVVCVANLAPRKMKFGVSEGMVVAAGPGGQDVFLLVPDSGAVPGQRVH
jgi:methionyl-tRNA synthetase